MSSRAVDDGGVRWSGLVVAAIGFTISRFTVANSLTMETGLIEFILTGAIGGTLIGVYAARAERRNRLISAQADRLHLLNRLLRDEVLNATTVILARADFLADEETTSDDHVRPLHSDYCRSVPGRPHDRVRSYR
jgi:hypothetical protein